MRSGLPTACQNWEWPGRPCSWQSCPASEGMAEALSGVEAVGSSKGEMQCQQQSHWLDWPVQSPQTIPSLAVCSCEETFRGNNTK